MSQFRRAPVGGGSILGALQATSLSETKASLPAEILASILDYLPVSDLMRFACVSRRMQEMVYDDTRWVARLKSMGCWDEAEARRRWDEAVARRQAAGERERRAPQVTIFDATTAGSGGFGGGGGGGRAVADVSRGFERMSVAGMPALVPQQPGQAQRTAAPQSPTAAAGDDSPMQDSSAVLDVLSKAKSVRGRARQEYARIYGALGPFYYDLVRARSHNDPVLFRVFRDPERQARMLSNLLTFSRSDWAEGAREREEKVTGMMGIFETAVLREFEQGYEVWDVEGRMKRYAHVLDALNGGNAAVELFIAKHPLFTDREVLADSVACLTKVDGVEGISLEPSRQFFEVLTGKLNEQGELMAKTFPKPNKVFWTFVDKIKDDVVMEYCTPLFDESHERSLASYLQAVSGVFEQSYLFYRSLQVPSGTNEESEEKAKEMALRTFEPHLDLYLQEELDFFIKNAEDEVQAFETRLSELDASAESFYMSNFNRQADKKDFLSSFKKVVMMPVTVLPSLPGQLLTAPFGGSSKSPAAASVSNGDTLQPASTPQPPRPPSPGMAGAFERRASPLPEQGEAPTDELAAKAALVASRLEGIKSLFSIEVALSLVHAAKTSLGRAAVFIRLGGQVGGEAREQCEAIFVNLLRILGNRHIKPGFDKAVGHLAHYNPREVTDHSPEKGGVAPLVMFIELVNLGDLISQMIDVFYEQQLAGPKIADRNDFLDASGLAKKKFEQMLDESVAAGLNKGIDVLMDEVEYICATTQLPTDYNPTPGGGSAATAGAEKNGGGKGGSSMGGGFDIGPTETAKRVVELVSSHTRMLVGTTEKSMLDVFNGEVGLRLFQAVCKHLKRQRVSTDGAIKVISDMNLYFEYVRTLKNADLLPYFKALRELSQIYLIDPRHSKEMATIIADGDRFGGVFRAEEVYKFAERRADWYQVKRDVEKAMYGLECSVM